MELAELGDLESCLKNPGKELGALKVYNLVSAAEQVAQALTYLVRASRFSGRATEAGCLMESREFLAGSMFSVSQLSPQLQLVNFSARRIGRQTVWTWPGARKCEVQEHHGVWPCHKLSGQTGGPWSRASVQRTKAGSPSQPRKVC